MIITNSSHASNQNAKYRQENVNNYIKLLDSLNALNPKVCPVFENGEIDDIQFGNYKIHHLCLHFHLHNENDIIRSFQTFKIEGGKKGVSDDLNLLFKSRSSYLHFHK